MVYTRKKRREERTFLLKNKNILITGGAGGLGSELVTQFVALGCSVIVLDRDSLGLSRLGQRYPSVSTHNCDLSTKASIDCTLDRLLQQHGRIDILINNAAVAHGKSLMDLTEQDLLASFHVNTLAPIWITQKVLPSMIKHRFGHIVDVCSILGTTGTPYLADYSSSKAALSAFHESLRRELRLLNYNFIGTTIVYPAKIKTVMFQKVKQNPLVPELHPADVASTIIQSIINQKATAYLPSYLQLSLALKLIPTAGEDLILRLGGHSTAAAKGI